MNGKTCVLPWIKGGGFVLSAKPWRFEDLKVKELHVDFVVLMHINARSVPWQMQFSLWAGAEGIKMSDWEEPIDVRNPAAAVTASLITLIRSLGSIKTSETPEELATPPQQHLPQYLVAIEQSLAVSTANIETNSDNPLFAERSIVDNLLSLAVAMPGSARTRCLLLNTLEKEARRRPDIVREYSEKLHRLQKEHPLRLAPTATILAAGLATLEAKIAAH